MMTPAFDRKVLSLLLGAVGLAVLPHIQHISATTFGFFCLLLAWRVLGLWYPQYLPGRLTVFLLLVLGCALLLVERQGIFGRDAGSSLLVIALGLKLMEMKQRRDAYLVVYMTFVVLATQFLFEQNILLGAYNGALSCLLLALLIAMNGLQYKLAQALKLAGLIILQAVPLALAMFILVPRLEPPRWLAFGTDSQHMSGLSDVLEPGSISNLGLSDELVFRAQFDGPIPPPSERYWRGPVMTMTNGKLWMQATDFSRYGRRGPKVSGQPYRYSLLMEPQTKNWVFALDMPVEYAGRLTRSPTYQLLTSANPGQRSAYKLTSYPAYNTGPLSEGEFQDAMQLPGPPSERIQALIRDLRAFDAQPAVFIDNVLGHFRHEKFRYTLEPPKLDDNPIESFLFETRAGFCSHYASAFVYLMRAAHIPARIVTGFQGGEVNEVGRFIRVRQADAHAWAEVWLQNRGWVRYDPTAAIAPERIEYPLDVSRLSAGERIYFDIDNTRLRHAFNLFKQARLFWGAVDYSWQRWVVDYNSLHQANFLSEFGIKDSRDMVYWLAAIVTVLTLLLSVSILHQKSRKIDPAMQVYARFCNKLAKKGLVKGISEGPRDFAERVKVRLPQHIADIERITDLFVELRYGRRASGDVKRLKQWVAAFKP